MLPPKESKPADHKLPGALHRTMASTAQQGYHKQTALQPWKSEVTKWRYDVRYNQTGPSLSTHNLGIIPEERNVNVYFSPIKLERGFNAKQKRYRSDKCQRNPILRTNTWIFPLHSISGLCHVFASGRLHYQSKDYNIPHKLSSVRKVIFIYIVWSCYLLAKCRYWRTWKKKNQSETDQPPQLWL